MNILNEVFEILAAAMVGLATLCPPNLYPPTPRYIHAVQPSVYCLIQSNLQEDEPPKTTTSTSASSSLNFPYSISASASTTSTTIPYPSPSFPDVS